MMGNPYFIIFLESLKKFITDERLERNISCIQSFERIILNENDVKEMLMFILEIYDSAYNSAIEEHRHVLEEFGLKFDLAYQPK